MNLNGEPQTDPMTMEVNDLITQAYGLVDTYCTALRKDGEPSRQHIDNVVDNCRAMGFDHPDIIITAILHDVIEDARDAGVWGDDVAPQLTGFPELVQGYVVTLTHLENEPYVDYIARVCDYLFVTPTIVKIADMIDNMSGSPSPAKKALYRWALPLLVKRLMQFQFASQNGNGKTLFTDKAKGKSGSKSS